MTFARQTVALCGWVSNPRAPGSLLCKCSQSFAVLWQDFALAAFQIRLLAAGKRQLRRGPHSILTPLVLVEPLSTRCNRVTAPETPFKWKLTKSLRRKGSSSGPIRKTLSYSGRRVPGASRLWHPDFVTIKPGVLDRSLCFSPSVSVEGTVGVMFLFCFGFAYFDLLEHARLHLLFALALLLLNS